MFIREQSDMNETSAVPETHQSQRHIQFDCNRYTAEIQQRYTHIVWWINVSWNKASGMTLQIADLHDACKGKCSRCVSFTLMADFVATPPPPPPPPRPTCNMSLIYDESTTIRTWGCIKLFDNGRLILTLNPRYNDYHIYNKTENIVEFLVLRQTRFAKSF